MDCAQPCCRFTARAALLPGESHGSTPPTSRPMQPIECSPPSPAKAHGLLAALLPLYRKGSPAAGRNPRFHPSPRVIHPPRTTTDLQAPCPRHPSEPQRFQKREYFQKSEYFQGRGASSPCSVSGASSPPRQRISQRTAPAQAPTREGQINLAVKATLPATPQGSPGCSAAVPSDAHEITETTSPERAENVPDLSMTESSST